MVLNQINRAVPYECGTANKCMNCNMMYMCARSPYCCFRNNNMDMAQPDLTPLQNAVSGLSGTVAQQAQDIDLLKSNIHEISERINLLNASMSNLVNTMGSEMNKLASKIDSIQSKESVQTNPVDETFDIKNENSSIVPYSKGNNEDTVLVEKKGIFGKTKWVEEKKS